MKRIIALLLCVSALIVMCSCAGAKKLYGVWYCDEGGERIAFQFSKSKDIKDGFIWVVHDIEKGETKSETTGYFSLSGGKIYLKFYENGKELVLDYKLSGEELTLSNDSTKLELKKYIIDN